ncbi:hypothetical protein [Candidatus Nanosyncoccus alces]|nr:hypothetical protein [Candidatus Nanosyncoccus alces]
MMRNTIISYVQKGAYFDDDVNIEISIHDGTSDELLLIIPGVDGSLDGYKNKYLQIAENTNLNYGATVIRMSNPYNLGGYHLRNLFEVLDFVEKNYDMTQKRLHVLGHSLGAYMIGSVASMYDYIDKILLINPATLLDLNDYKSLKLRPKDSNIILIGEKDPSVEHIELFKDLGTVNIQRGADHHFSGSSFEDFLEATSKYIFKNVI